MIIILLNHKHEPIFMCQCLVLSCRYFIMADSIMSKAATMEIPINSNGDTGTLPEDDSLEQVSQSHFQSQVSFYRDCIGILWFYVFLHLTADSRNCRLVRPTVT